MSRKLVIALGGNALGQTPAEQRTAVRTAASHMADLIGGGDRMILVHGNGTQVGMISLAFEQGASIDHRLPAMPLAECCAMSQGYIGFHLQQALQEQLTGRGLHHAVATVVTQVVVDRADPAFLHPVKPVGYGYTPAEAARISSRRGHQFAEDSGRGLRRVVPSPEPVAILEQDLIRQLIEQGTVVIACGGGGIPVFREEGHITGAEAIIDKDKAAARLAAVIQADMLVILTSVPCVALNYGRPDQRWIEQMTVSQALRYMADGQFAPGSMLPKVEASIRFVQSGPGRQAIIAGLDKAYLAVTRHSGTLIVAD